MTQITELIEMIQIIEIIQITSNLYQISDLKPSVEIESNFNTIQILKHIKSQIDNEINNSF